MKEVPYCCLRMGGRDKGNILLRRANFVGTKNCGGEKARAGREAARPCVSKGAKPAKIVSLIEKDFCAPLKNVSIFAGFVRRQTLRRGSGRPKRRKFNTGGREGTRTPTVIH
jgi:hypothetical protein